MGLNRLAAAVVIGLTVVGAIVSGAAVASAADPDFCRPTMILGIPGTGQGVRYGGDPYGKEVGAAVENAVTTGGGYGVIHTEPLDYPAAGFPPPNLLLYTLSKSEGYASAYGKLTEWVELCATTRPNFVLIGYSQGAHIAGDLAATISRGGAPALVGRLIGTLLMGDTLLRAEDPKVSWINGPPKSSGGILGQRAMWRPSDPVYSVCIAADVTCDLQFLRYGAKIHQSYDDHGFGWSPPPERPTPDPGQTIAEYFGALLAFERFPGNPTNIQLTASDGANDDHFGYSVAVSGDSAVVGAPHDNSAYVFQRTEVGWTQRAKLAAADGDADDFFGASVTIDADTIVIGAPSDDTSRGENAGSAYVFVRSETGWTQQRKLTLPTGAAYDHFGGSVALDGDTVIVGAVHDGPTGDDYGLAHVFVRSGTGWLRQATLSSGASGRDEFGFSVDVDGDTVVVGAYAPFLPAGSEAAYVFSRSGTTWTRQAKLVSGESDYNNFGSSVAIDGDTIVIGASEDDTFSGARTGSAHVFTLSGTVWTRQPLLTAPDAGFVDGFGSVAVDRNTIAIGAVGDDGRGDDAGAVYLFTRSESGWTYQAKLTATDGSDRDYFGTVVAVDGDTVVVGAPNDDTPRGVDAGSAYIDFRLGPTCECPAGRSRAPATTQP